MRRMWREGLTRTVMRVNDIPTFIRGRADERMCTILTVHAVVLLVLLLVVVLVMVSIVSVLKEARGDEQVDGYGKRRRGYL